MKTGDSSEERTFWKKVFWGLGETWFMLLKARPSRPSELVSETNWLETAVASSIAWLVTVAEPMFTVSVPTVPDAPLSSPYSICQV